MDSDSERKCSPAPLPFLPPPSCPETATWSWDNNTPFFAYRRSTRSVAYCVRSSVASTRLGALAVVLTWGQTDIVTQVFSSTRLFSVLHKPHFCTFATPSPFSERAAHALCAFPRGFLFFFFLLSSTKPLPPFIHHNDFHTLATLRDVRMSHPARLACGPWPPLSKCL